MEPGGAGTDRDAVHDAGATTKSVAYVLKRYPRLSETFILNEILALEALGAKIRIVSIHTADAKVRHTDAWPIRAPVYYLPETIGPHLPRMLRVQAHFLTENPGRWARAFVVMFWRHSFKAVKHWLKAGLVAQSLEGTDVGHIHAHFSTSPTAIAMMASLLLGIRYSLTCHAKDVYAEDRLHSPGFLRNLIRARFVVVNSERVKEDILGAWPELPPESVHVVYNGLDLDRFRLRPSDPDGRLILSVGRFVEKKGFPYLVEACRLLADRHGDFRCEIVAYGDGRSGLLGAIAAGRLEDRVRLIDGLEQDELLTHYADASVFCLATLIASNDDRDILPNVVKEAMAVGVPVVTTSVPGMEELVQDERTGLLVPPKDPEALSLALERLLADAALRSRLARAGRRVIEDRFDRSKNALELFQLLGECLASASTEAPRFTRTRRRKTR